MTKRRILVAGGLISAPDREGVFLLTRRKSEQELGGFWEFPGGKVEPGESPTEAVKRELREELGIKVSVGDVFEIGFHGDDTKDIILIIYCCSIVHGTPRCHEAEEMRWLSPNEIVNLRMPPADEPILDKLRKECLL